MDRENTPCPKFIRKFLPQHIIVEEILPRLPAKSLFRFRCVSKSWASLIDSKPFIKTHLQNSNSSTNTNRRLILSCRGGIRIKQCSRRTLTRIDAPNICLLRSLSLVGCFNGVVCLLYNSRSFVLWNPSTRKFKELPDAYEHEASDGGCSVRIYWLIFSHGFGWDESSDDYKVFAVVVASEEPIGRVYSWKTNSWRTVEHMEGLPPVYKEGTFVGGKLHWGRYSRGGKRRDIVCFDLMGAEVWEKMELPYLYTEDSDFHAVVGVIGGCLASVKEYKRTRAEVWVMKEYGVEESWLKLVATSDVQELVRRPLQYAVAVGGGGGDDGEVMLFFGRFFLVYNPKRNEFGGLRQFNDNVYQQNICVESLVWPQLA